MEGARTAASWSLRVAASLLQSSSLRGLRDPCHRIDRRGAAIYVSLWEVRERQVDILSSNRSYANSVASHVPGHPVGGAISCLSAACPAVIGFSKSFSSSLFSLSVRSPLSWPPPPLAVAYNRQSVRSKMVKSSAYHRRPRASPTGQSQKAHVGPRRLPAEYVSPGVLLVKQRRYIAWGFENKRRHRHKKMYPGENVGVAKDTSLVSLVHGRVKYTHETERDVMLCNVLPEPREELLRDDLWRYRTEHVRTKEENRHVCHLRMKATRVFPKELVNPPKKPLPRPKWLSRFDHWENPTLPDAPPLCDDK